MTKQLPTDTRDYKWWIPITFTTPGGNWNDTYNKVWMKDSEKIKIIDGLPNKNEAAIFNVQETGKYLTLYMSGWVSIFIIDNPSML